MMGWAVYIKPRTVKGPALYAYTCWGAESGEEAIEWVRALDLAALWRPDLFEPVALPVLRVSAEKYDAQSSL